MIVEHAFEVEMVNPEDDYTLNDMITSSGQICGTELLDASIEDVINSKKTMVSKMDSVISLMKEVEYEEIAAEHAKKDAAQSHSDIMLKVYELMCMQQHVKKENDMLAREAYVQKKHLSTKMEGLELHVASLLDKGDRSLELLDEMSRSMEMRLASAITKKKSSIIKKQKNEAFARAALAYEETQMGKVEEESNRLKREAAEISKLQEFLIDRAHLVTVLHGEISDKCRDVKRLKEELDQVVLPGGKMSFGRNLSVSASSTSTVSSIIPCQPPPKPVDCDVLFKKGSGITRGIKKVKIKGKLYQYQMKIKGKLCSSQMFTKCIKKVKIKGKVQRSEMFVKRVKKVNIKRKLHGNQVCAKSINELKIKGKRHGSQVCARSIKKSKIKGRRHGSQVSAKSIKKSKIKGRQHGSQMCAKSIKKSKIKGKGHGSQSCVNSINKVKVKIKLHGNQPCPKRIKKVRPQKRGHMCAKNIKKVKIKGLMV